MNNTRYPNLFCDKLPLEGKRLRELSVSYRTEAPLGKLYLCLPPKKRASGFSGASGVPTVSSAQKDGWSLRIFKGENR